MPTPTPPAPPIPPPVQGAQTYCVIYYLAGDAWYPVASGWDVDIATLIYEAPTYVFVWWWTGSGWTSEVVYGGGHGNFAGTPVGLGLARTPAGLGAAADDAASLAGTLVGLAIVAGGLYGFYLLVKKR